MKVWADNDDKILSLLAKDLIERRLFKVEIFEESVETSHIREIQQQLTARYGISIEDTRYLMSLDTMQKDMYDIHDDHIDILYNDGTMKDIAEASEILNVSLLSKKIRKYYLCYQRMS